MAAVKAAPRARVIVVVGGGFSAATFAVQLVRHSRVPHAIYIVEPREQLGRGLAYSATDPDHRLNGPVDSHGLDPEQPDELRSWCVAKNLLRSDPECFAPGGQLFIRRSDFGAYLFEQISLHSNGDYQGSIIRHVRDTAVGASFDGTAYQVETAAHGAITADMLVVATGNPHPTLRPPFEARHRGHPRIIANPLRPDCLTQIPVDTRVLVVGSGLTAFDTLSTFVRRGHAGELLAISRRGLQPRSHSPEIVQGGRGAAKSAALRIDLTGPVPEFITRESATARRWLRALRAEIRRQEQEGHSWHEAFDAVRNVVGRIWPSMPLAEQRRFLRRLHIWYDVHRFRLPPMNEQLVRAAERSGQVRFAAARLVRVEPKLETGSIEVEMFEGVTGKRLNAHFDWIVNCTGLDHARAPGENPFLHALLASGLIRAHPNGLGFDVSQNCEALDADSRPQCNLRVIGPPTAGAFGDPLGVAFIAAQVRRILPDVLRSLEV